MEPSQSTLSLNTPILVTGSHRSGTTWAGKILASSPNVVYIDEPFNRKNIISRTTGHFDVWFKYLHDDNDDAFEELLSRVLSFRYPTLMNLKDVRLRKEVEPILRTQYYGIFHRGGMRPLMKDPIAFFSAPWLAEKFKMNVLVLIRHPAAFTSSLKIKNWSFDFDNFRRQEALMEACLSPFREEIEKFSRERQDIVEQAILLWNCIHHVILEYRQRFPDWVFVRHEDLSLHPVQNFKEIFGRFGLAYTSRVEDAIQESTGSHNPAEQRKRSEFKRDSKANIKNWKQRLTDEEIGRIRRKTSHVAAHFYCDDEW